MRAAHFYLKIRPEELLEYYQGFKSFVRVRTYEGYSIQFRAEHLRQWVTPIGIHGEFQIRFDDQNKFMGLALYRDLSGMLSERASAGASSGSSRPKLQAKSSPPAGGPSQRPRGFNKSI